MGVESRAFQQVRFGELAGPPVPRQPVSSVATALPIVLASEDLKTGIRHGIRLQVPSSIQVRMGTSGITPHGVPGAVQGYEITREMADDDAELPYPAMGLAEIPENASEPPHCWARKSSAKWLSVRDH